MQVDMHFYGTYAMARIAGFTPEEARTIATAAQFVDEAVDAEPVNLNGLSYLLPVVSAHKMYELIENSDVMDQWRVWVPFHFLPGGLGNRIDDKVVCAWGDRDNPVAESVINFALAEKGQPWDLHLLGVVTHVIQDTYAHYGFSGFATDRNAIKQSSLVSEIDDIGDILGIIWDKAIGGAAEASRLGHASVSTCPDTPYLEWRFKYEDKPDLSVSYDLEDRDNKVSFLRSCTRLLALYEAFRGGQEAIQTADGHALLGGRVETNIKAILSLDERDKDDRSEQWRERIEAQALFQASFEDRDLRYDHTGWEFEYMQNAGASATTTDAYLYNRAAARYLEHVNDVLQEMGILSN